jgi:hypothetical protein
MLPSNLHASLITQVTHTQKIPHQSGIATFLCNHYRITKQDLPTNTTCYSGTKLKTDNGASLITQVTHAQKMPHQSGIATFPAIIIASPNRICPPTQLATQAQSSKLTMEMCSSYC